MNIRYGLAVGAILGGGAAVATAAGAVNAGDADAENKLATLYDDGLGVTQDPVLAFDLYRRAAARGYTPAMANMGRMYIEARGVERNDVRGYALIHAAVETGIPQSMEAMANQGLKAATARLNEEQLARAHDVSRKLVATFAPPPVAQR